MAAFRRCVRVPAQPSSGGPRRPERGLPSLLILEDDVLFDPSFSEKFPVFVRGLPADWDMVFLGALHREDPVPVAENVVRIRHAYSTYAYALRNSIFDAFIAANYGSPNQVDVNNGMLQSNHIVMASRRTWPGSSRVTPLCKSEWRIIGI